MYLYFSPSLSLTGNADDSLNEYFFIQILCFLFFSIPFILFYSQFRRFWKKSKEGVTSRIVLNRFSYILFIFVFCILGICFFAYVLESGVLITRIGSEARADMAVEAGGNLLGIVARLFEKNALFFSNVILFFVLYFRVPFIVRIIFFSIYLLYLIFVLINSKLFFIVFLINIICVINSKRIFKGEPALKIKPFILGAVLIYYSYVVSTNIRNDFFYTQSFKIEYFYPWKTQKGDSDGESLIKRMDGIDLMAKISVNLTPRNISYGGAWGTPIFLIYGPLINKAKSDELKSTGNTTTKRALLQRHTSIDSYDYYSSCVSDLFGNFHFIGLLFGSLIFALIVSYIDSILSTTRKTTHFNLLLSFYLLSYILFFEQEFIGIIGSIIQSLPIFFFFCGWRLFQFPYVDYKLNIED
jgi:hypothetical protein